MRTALAWLVHLYTALGLVCAAAMTVLIFRGDDASMRWTFVLMIVATAIDATDGWLARRARVNEVLPDFDGSTLDNLVDFHTYTSLPLLLLWRAQVPGGRWSLVLVAPLLASAYGYSKTDAKTADGFFLGFPSYWNIVALYLYLLRPSDVLAALVILTLSALTFVRTPYLYATRGGPFARTINGGAVVWALLLWTALFGARTLQRSATVISLAYPLLYLALSVRVARQRR